MIISNTTPISNFLNIGQINLLKRFFTTIHIPHAVYKEINMHFSNNLEWQKSLDEKFIFVHSLKPSAFLGQLLVNLHPGESEALCLYLEKNASLCLLDDRDARILAQLHKINITGTLGLLIQAKKKGYIQSVKTFMNELKQYHFWINNAMYNKVLLLAHEN